MFTHCHTTATQPWLPVAGAKHIPTALTPRTTEKETEVTALKAEIEHLKAKHAVDLQLKEAQVKIEMQPKLNEAYDRG